MASWDFGTRKNCLPAVLSRCGSVFAGNAARVVPRHRDCFALHDLPTHSSFAIGGAGRRPFYATEAARKCRVSLGCHRAFWETAAAWPYTAEFRLSGHSAALPMDSAVVQGYASAEWVAAFADAAIGRLVGWVEAADTNTGWRRHCALVAANSIIVVDGRVA